MRVQSCERKTSKRALSSAACGLMATCGLSSATMSVASLMPSPPPAAPPSPPATAPPPAELGPGAEVLSPCGTALATPSARTLTSGACTHFLSAERQTLHTEAICSGWCASERACSQPCPSPFSSRLPTYQ